jgi:hypothetical protein
VVQYTVHPLTKLSHFRLACFCKLLIGNGVHTASVCNPEFSHKMIQGGGNSEMQPPGLDFYVDWPFSAG